MGLLFLYVFVAIFFSFLCSILEAVLLSVNSAYITTLINKKRASGKLLEKWKSNIGEPLVAILTLNTMAHTIGAVGAGAQAATVFGSASVGIFSAILTLLILIFSEIIPKTLGAQYWRELAPFSAHTLKYMIWLLYPLIKAAETITKRFKSEQTLCGFSREEFAAMADLSSAEGQLEQQESYFLKNLLLLRKIRVKDAMTPRVMIFSLSGNLLVEEYFHKYDQVFFSRIPIFKDNSDNIIGYVFRSDLLLAQARSNGDNRLENYLRPIAAVLDVSPIQVVFNQAIKDCRHLFQLENQHFLLLYLYRLQARIFSLPQLQLLPF